jgi:chemotaxis response regulator CheB
LRRIFERGGLALVQDPATAESPTMPAAAVRCVPEAKVLRIADIARTLTSLTPADPAATRGHAVLPDPGGNSARTAPGGA